MTSRSNFETFYALGANGKFGPAKGPTIAQLLSEAGGRPIGIDARGHGRSGRSDNPDRYRGAAHAHDVSAVLDSIGADAAHVIGYSMGSMTAMRLGVLDLRVRSMALCGTGTGLVDATSQETMASIGELGECFRSNDWSEHPQLKQFRAYARLDDAHHFPSLGAAALGLEPIPSDSLRRIHRTVLVLNGGGDNGDDDAAQLAAMIPGATSAVVGTANHGTACSDREFQNALLEFVTGQWTGDVPTGI